MQNLILTDIMKTGHHYFYGEYINFAKLEQDSVDIINDYYLLPDDLSKYSRKIALICSINPDFMKIKQYELDLNTRLDRLKKLGFKFIIASPWESKANVPNNSIINKYSTRCISTWFGTYSWFWYFMYQRHLLKKNRFHINHTEKKYTFLYLNKLGRQHRKDLYKRLQKTDILNKSLYSFLDQAEPVKLPKEYEAPWLHPGIYNIQNINGQDQDIFEPPYNDSMCSLITESNVESTTEIFITEKIYKAIIMKHIFVVYGNYKTLDCLKQQGFKTFDSIFDESYDQELSYQKREEKIVEVCQQIKNMDPKALYEKTQEIRDHNFETFFEKSNIIKNSSKTISDWFTLYDQAV